MCDNKIGDVIDNHVAGKYKLLYIIIFTSI